MIISVNEILLCGLSWGGNRLLSFLPFLVETLFPFLYPVKKKKRLSFLDSTLIFCLNVQQKNTNSRAHVRRGGYDMSWVVWFHCAEAVFTHSRTLDVTDLAVTGFEVLWGQLVVQSQMDITVAFLDLFSSNAVFWIAQNGRIEHCSPEAFHCNVLLLIFSVACLMIAL